MKNTNTQHNIGARLLSMLLLTVMLMSLLVNVLSFEAVAAAVDGVASLFGAAGGPTAVKQEVSLKVVPLNSRMAGDQSSTFTEYEERAYPQNGYVTFRVYVYLNGSQLAANTAIPNNITFSYRTYDLSAIASTGDYTAIKGTHEFKQGVKESYYDFTVAVNSTEYGLYHCWDNSKWWYKIVDWHSSSAWKTFYTDKNYGSKAPKDTGYITRTFGFEIYDVTGASVYHTANVSDGTNVYYDYAIGTLPVKHYLPYGWAGDGWQLMWYSCVGHPSSDAVKLSKGSITYSKWTSIRTELGNQYVNDIINTGIGHIYATVTGHFRGDDLSQRDAYVGIVYDGWENATSVTDRTLMLEKQMGIVMYELDGYPSYENVNFSAYRDEDNYGVDYDEIEWSEDCYQFEKYRTVIDSRYRYNSYNLHYAYKLEGAPKWIGLAGKRYSYGENREVSQTYLTVVFRDDSPVEIEDIYVEDTETFTKTLNDTLRIYVRFNEPVQIDPKNKPYLVCGLNNANVTAADAENGVQFVYERGAGSDTLVFTYDLKNLPSTAVVSQIEVFYYCNGKYTTDFSSTESIHITTKKNNDIVIAKGVDFTNDIVTKETGTRWSVAKTYYAATDADGYTSPVLIGPEVLQLTKSIDPRVPTVMKIVDENAGKSAKNHTAHITLNASGLDVKVYAHWTDDLNGSTDTVIPRPTSYSENEIVVASSSTAKDYFTTANLDGTVYLWVRAETAFGNVDERLCGPFYFDNAADTVSDIHVVDGSFSAQSKVKTIEFTVDHTSDYLSCSGSKIYDSGKNTLSSFDAANIQLTDLYLVYANDSVWGSNTEVTKKLLFSKTSNARNLTAKIATTKSDYVYKFGFTSDNLAKTPEATCTTDSFIDKETNGASKKATYITKVTYRINIGYDPSHNMDDFGFLDAQNTVVNEYAKVFLGFLGHDACTNVKEPTSVAFEAGKDYVNTEYAYFDLRNIKSSTITYDQQGNKQYDALVTKNGTSIDSTVNVFSAASPFNVRFTFPLDSRVLTADLTSPNYAVRVYVNKKNSTIGSDGTTDCAAHLLSTWGTQTAAGKFVGNPSSDPTATNYTSWFSWTLTGKTGTDPNSSYGTMLLTTYTSASVKDICGYYEVYFSFTNSQNETVYTPSATFYIGTGDDTTKNAESINDGKLYINKVFQLPAESRYYYQTAAGDICDPYYAQDGGAMTFSSEALARRYLLYKEYLDLYLWQVPDDETADSLNLSSGNMSRSDADIKAGKKAQVGEWWIRYKIKSWAPGSKDNNAAWIYYFVSDGGTTPTIDVDNLPSELYTALNTVVSTIMAQGSTVVLYGSDNRNATTGAPKISETCVQVEPLSAEYTLCGSQFARNVSFQGDSAIYDAVILFDEEGVSKEYRLASTALLNIENQTNVYISPYNGVYAGIWGKLPSGKGVLLKSAINVAYRQILIAGGQDASTLGNVSAPSGRYVILEVDENGYSYSYVYVDKDAPQINFQYTDYDENGKPKIAEKYNTSGKETNLIIHGISFTLRGIGTYGAEEGKGQEEIDKYAYVVVYNSTKTKATAYTVDDLRLQNPVLREEGTYYLEVWDRSGNSFEFTVKLVSKPMDVKVYSEDGVKIKVSNRQEDQISLYEVKRDGITIDTKFAASKTYSENGLYSIRIVDFYGTEFTYEIKFSREIPAVTWRTAGSATTEIIGDTSLCAKLSAVDSVTYNVVTSVPVSFRFSTSAGINVEFLEGMKEEDFTKTPGVFTTYTQNELGDCQIKCSYADHPNVYVVYNVIVDTVPPVIDVEYDQYAFESRAQFDAMLQFLEMEDYTVGQTVIPRRIDFAMLSSTTLKVASGSSVFTSEARLTLRDASGISRLKIERNKELIYDGTYIESGEYPTKDGTVNYNVFTEYGNYTITAFDTLNNRTVFTFTNTTSNDVLYTVDGVQYVPTYTYVYEKDADGREILDENGEKIVKEKWLFLRKFEEDANQTVPAEYQNVTDKFSPGNYFRKTQTFNCLQYGNTSQSIVISRDSDVQILLTYQDSAWQQIGGDDVLVPFTANRFIGLRVENNAVYLYRYVVSDDGYDEAKGENRFSVGQEVELIPIISLQEAAIGTPKVIYDFDAEVADTLARLGICLTATYSKDGKLTLTVNAPSDPTQIVTSEIKVTQIEGAFEPSYYKTVLSKYQSSVELYNENGVINMSDEEIGAGQWKYANGTQLSVNLSAITDPYLSAVLIAYSKTMTPGTYHYLYSTDETVETEEYFGEGDGYYFVKTVNVFGNEKIYRLAISNSLLVSTVAEYQDGWTRQFATVDDYVVSANKFVTVSFRNADTITYAVTKNGVAYTPATSEKSGAVVLVFNEEGEYEVTVRDEYGNVVQRSIRIKNKSLNLPVNILINPQTRALRYAENYTNMKVSVNALLLAQYDIAYIAVQKQNGSTVVLLDEISGGDERMEAANAALSECIGLAGDGDYVVVFRDSYGNRAEKTVHYRETPTLLLTRMTSRSQKAESFSLEDAQNPAINFISNSALFFNTVATQYEFYVDGTKVECPKTISFTNNETVGRTAYEIEYVDEYGFFYQFTAVLYRTVIDLELAPSVGTVTVGGVLMTTDNIRVLFSEDATCYYQLENGEYHEFPADGILKKDGSYLIFAEDIAGNYSYFTVTKDSVVQYSFREGRYGKKIERGLVTGSSSVLFQAENGDSAKIKAAFLNGNKVDEGNGYVFSKNGLWEVVVGDDAGNESLFFFYVYTHEVNYLDYYEPQDFDFTDIWYNATGAGQVSINWEIRTEDDGRSHIVFADAGTYIVVMNSVVTGAPVSFSIEISETLPSATLNGVEEGGATIENISISNTKKDDTVTVYRNGKAEPVTVFEVGYDGEKLEISEEGEYTVVVRNRAGNEVTFHFTRKHVANTAGSVLIILLMAAIVVGLFAGMTYRNKSKVDK